MSLAVVRYNAPFIRGNRDKEAYIRQILDLEDGAVVALLVLWRG